MTTSVEYARRKSDGLCLQCGKSRDTEHPTQCSSCTRKLHDKYANRLAANKCVDCQEPAATNLVRCQRCHDSKLSQQSQRRAVLKSEHKCFCGSRITSNKSTCDSCLDKAKALRLERKANSLCRSCGRPASKSRCQGCLDINKSSEQNLRRTVFEAYGGAKCSCCGETIFEFLALDHMDGGGNLHRKQVTNVYRWVRDNNYPVGFQVLCANCNWGRQVNGGVCPHKRVMDESSKSN